MSSEEDYAGECVNGLNGKFFPGALHKPTLDDLVKKAEEEEVYLKREIDRHKQMLSRNKATLAKLRTVQKLVTPEMEASIVALRDIGVI